MYLFPACTPLSSGVLLQQINLVQACHTRCTELATERASDPHNTQMCVDPSVLIGSQAQQSSGSKLNPIHLTSTAHEAASECESTPTRSVSPATLFSSSSRTTVSDVDDHNETLLVKQNRSSASTESSLLEQSVPTKSSRLSRMLFFKRFCDDIVKSNAIAKAKDAGQVLDRPGSLAYEYVLDAYREQRGVVSDSAAMELYEQGYIATWSGWDTLEEAEYKSLAEVYERARLCLDAKRVAKRKASGDDCSQVSSKSRHFSQGQSTSWTGNTQSDAIPVIAKRGRGRPKGSKISPRSLLGSRPIGVCSLHLRKLHNHESAHTYTQSGMLIYLPRLYCSTIPMETQRSDRTQAGQGLLRKMFSRPTKLSCVRHHHARQAQSLLVNPSTSSIGTYLCLSTILPRKTRLQQMDKTRL